MTGDQRLSTVERLHWCKHVPLCVDASNEIKRLRDRLDKIAEHPDTPELIRQYAADMF